MPKHLHDYLKRTHAYASGQLKLSAASPAAQRLIDKVMQAYEQANQLKLLGERRVLSGDVSVSTSTTQLPASFQQEVIRAALSDLSLLDIIRSDFDPAAQVVVEVPYEERLHDSRDFPNFGVVYEGHEIRASGSSIKLSSAFVLPVKLALKVSNEVIHFSQANSMNWDAWADNIAANARTVKELLQLRIAANMQQASDRFAALAITGEAFTADASGVIKTAQFPVVRPFEPRNLTSALMGDVQNPITITVGGVAVHMWQGGDVPAGLYWRFASLNLGCIQLCDESGLPAGDGATGELSYSYATNIIKFDLDTPAGVKKSDHMDGLLDAIGDGAAVLSGKRFSRADYLLMSSILNNEASKASQFAVSLKRSGTDTDLAGDLETLKAIPAYDTNLSGDLGDERILLGQRGLTSYVIARPYEVGQVLFESVGANGVPTGQKMAYGEEYSAVHTPMAVSGRYTSVLAYHHAER